MFCSNCQRNIATGNYLIHTLHCERWIQLCRLCNEPVLRQDLQYHMEENHPLGKCSGCDIVMEICYLEQHEVKNCLKRRVSCNFCHSDVSFDEILAHEEICAPLNEKCNASCSTFIQCEDKDSHPQICPKDYLTLLVLCKFCNLEFPHETFPEHKISCGSRTEQCNVCHEYVMLKDQKYHHNTCGRKANRQDSKDCWGDRWSKYTKSSDDCELDDILTNSASWDDGWSYSTKKTTPCGYCKKKFRRGSLAEHKKICPERFEDCPTCKMDVMLRNKLKHKTNCKVKKELDELMEAIEKLKCTVRDQDVRIKELEKNANKRTETTCT